MTRINTNVASLRGLRSVERANSLLNTSLQRLSTGVQINSGKDDPAGLIASETLKSQIVAIETSIKNSNRANNVIATADSALGEISGLLNQIRGLVQEGLNTGALSQTEIDANQLQIDSALSAINRISANATFGGDKLIDGSKSFTTQLTTANSAKISEFQIDEAVFGSSSTILVDATITTAAEKGSLVYTGGDLTQETTVEIAGSVGSQVLFFGSSSTYENIRDAINAATDVTGVEATFVDDAGTAAATAGTVTLAATGAAATAGTATFTSAGNENDLSFTAATAGAFSGTNAVSVVFSLNADTNDASSVSVTGNEITISLENDTNAASVAVASDIEALFNANTNATALASISLPDDSGTTGSGVVSGGLTNATLNNGTENFDTNNDIVITNDTSGLLTGTNIPSVAFSLQSDSNDGTSVSVSGSAITVALAVDATQTDTSSVQASDVIAAINSNTSAAALVTASNAAGNDGSGVFNYTSAAQTINGTDASSGSTAALTLTSQNFGSAEFVEVNVLAGSFDTYDSTGTSAVQISRDSGTDVVANINGQVAQGTGLKASVSSANLVASLTFNSANNVAAETAQITITGGGSLFQIGQEVSAAGQLGMGIEAINTARLGGISGKIYELGSGRGKSLNDVGPNVTGADLVNIIDESINRVSNLRGRLGAVQKNVIETNITSLGVALENISAARSEIIDTDFAAETAQLTKSQILSQAAISVLQIANNNPQQVLTLLG
ncbi:B-type flagellin [Symmachiella dynata]|uniref:flagellin N-terminal helical domain-containing protein n=1 Tax=Symmachiella dynata TaxID=2527995 RepID=UPI00118841B9|nr:flagellin [Symmachiella dynata]QDT51882.1 B-type flagellin [Symmachiella dynata]